VTFAHVMHDVCMLQTVIASLTNYISTVPCMTVLIMSENVILTGE